MGTKRLSGRMITELRGYVQRLGIHCPKPSQKFLWSMSLGLVLSGSVLLSQVARKLHAVRMISFHALHKSLCRGLKSPQWGVFPIQDAYLQEAAGRLSKDRVIACDLGDITKTRAHRMPGLQTVRDGSTGELRKGWWLLEIEAVCGKGKKHLPLWLELFSVSHRRYQSTWTVVEKAITHLVERIGRRGVWVFDRGFDSERFFTFLIGCHLTFLVRVNAKRHVIDGVDERRKSLGKAAAQVTATTSFLWRRPSHGKALLLEAGFKAVEIPQSQKTLSLIVVRGFGRHPLLFLTNGILKKTQDAVAWARLYLKRWGVEEAGRLIKQAFDLENIRVLSWVGLVKLVWLAMWTYGFLCLIRLKSQRFYRQVLSLYPAFGPVPPFPYYRLAGAAAWLLLMTILTNPSLLGRT